MVFAALRGRGLAHSFGQRSPVISYGSSSASAAPSTTPQSVVTPSSHSVKALASVVALFGIAIVVIVVWRIGVWLRIRRLADAVRRKGEKPVYLDVEKGFSEKVYVVPRPQEGTTWVPQIKPTRPTEISVPPVAAHKTSRSKQLWENVRKLSSENSPPPAYFVANNTTERYTPETPSPTVTKDKPPSPVVPLRPMPPTPQSPFATLSPPLSPRSSSFSHRSLSQSSPRSTRGKRRKKFPRLMAVSDTFVPALEDELPIKLDEVVRLLEEYDDGWCLVQRVGRADAPKGVVPRLCLRERPEVIPALGRRVSYVKTPSHSRLPFQPLAHDDPTRSSVVTVVDLPVPF